MLALALGWAAVGYALYLCGVLWSLPSRGILSLIFVLLVGISIWWGRRKKLLEKIWAEIKKLWSSDWLGKLLVSLVVFQLLLNLVGALSPELSFDALWYHLSLPKMYLFWGKIEFPKGNLLQSGLPRLGEIWYTLALALDSTASLAKLLHLLAGLWSFLLIYIGAKKFSSNLAALLLGTSWYTMLSVSWLSTTGYVDLFAVVFVLLASREIVEYKRWWLGGLLLGLAASVKFIFFLPAVILVAWVFAKESTIYNRFRSVILFGLGLFVATIPWLGVSWIKTGDPLYPLLRYQPASVVGAPLQSFTSRLLSLPFALWSWTIHPDTPISPIYLGLLPLLVIGWWKLNEQLKSYLIFGAIFILAVWFFPEFSNRYLLPGLAVLMIPLSALVSSARKELNNVLCAFILVTVVAGMAARTATSRKFIPYFFGVETKDEFLAKNLNLDFGNFFDEGGRIARIVDSQTVLVTGIHNVFYVDFPFDHVSWADGNKKYRYILVGVDGRLPPGYLRVKLIYKDRLTGASLFFNDEEI